MAENTPYFSVKSIGLSKVGHRKPCDLLTAARHNLREIQAEQGATGHIDPTRSHSNTILQGPALAAGVQALANDLLKSHGIHGDKLRRDHCQAIEAVFSLAQQTGVADTAAYFNQCLAWLAAALSLPVLSAVIHRDESAAHLHVLLLPVQHGQHLGSKPIDRAALKKLRDGFFAKVAGPAGLQRPNAKLHGMAKRWAIAAVLQHCEAQGLPALNSVLWPLWASTIERDPTAAMLALGINPNTIKPSNTTQPQPIDHSTSTVQALRKHHASTVQALPAPYACHTHAPHETTAYEPAPNPIGIESNPIGFEKQGENHRTLSCVGFDHKTPPQPSPKAIESLDDLWCAVGHRAWCTTKRNDRLQKAHAAQQSAIARHTQHTTTPPPAPRVDDDGLTRERDEHCHDLSAWD